MKLLKWKKQLLYDLGIMQSIALNSYDQNMLTWRQLHEMTELLLQNLWITKCRMNRVQRWKSFLNDVIYWNWTIVFRMNTHEVVYKKIWNYSVNNKDIISQIKVPIVKKVMQQ